MDVKTMAGWGLLALGTVGMLNQFFMIQALSSGVAPTAALSTFDPASLLKIANPAGAGYTSPGMLTDAAVAAAGAYLLFW